MAMEASSASSNIKNVSPGDPAVIADIVNYIKSEGIFDEMRRECLSDVDTKPAFQNLKQRVEGFSSNFLAKINWQPDLNKNQLRDNLRAELNKSGMMAHGLDHLVDQVVRQKASRSFLPRIREVFYNYSGLKDPEDNQPIPLPVPGFPFNVPPPNVSKNMVFKPPESIQSKKIDEKLHKTERSSPGINLSEKKMLEPGDDVKKEIESSQSDSSCSSFDNVSRKHEIKPSTKTMFGNVVDGASDPKRKNSETLSDNKEKEETKSLPQKHSKSIVTAEDKRCSDDKAMSAFDRLLKSGKPGSSSSSKLSGALKDQSKHCKDSEISKSPDYSKVKLSSKYAQNKAEESDSETLPPIISSKENFYYKNEKLDASEKFEKKQKSKQVQNCKNEKNNVNMLSDKSSPVSDASDSSNSEPSSPCKLPDIENFRIFSENKSSSLKIDSHKEYVSSSSEQCDDYENKTFRNSSKNKAEASSDKLKTKKSSSSGTKENQTLHDEDDCASRLSDVTVSSVHTSDLSSYDDQISLSSEEELDVTDSFNQKVSNKIKQEGEESFAVDSEVKDERSSEHLVDSMKMGLRRKRKINPKYTSNEFSSIFTKEKRKKEENKADRLDLCDSKLSPMSTDSKRTSRGFSPLRSDCSSSTSNDEASANCISDANHCSNDADSCDSNTSNSKLNRSASQSHSSTQRYDSSDLYKPRPVIHSKRRGSRSNDKNETEPKEQKKRKRKKKSPNKSSKTHRS